MQRITPLISAGVSPNEYQCNGGSATARATLECASDARNGTNATTPLVCLPEYRWPSELAARNSTQGGYHSASGIACGAAGSNATMTTDPATCSGVVCTAGYFGHVTYSPAARPGGEVVLGGCRPCFDFRGVASVARCTGCTGAEMADCSRATCAAGYHTYHNGSCTPEAHCSAFIFGAGVRGDAAHADPCTPGVRLSTHTNPSCGLACSEHFVGCRRRGTCIAVVSCASSEKCGTVLLDECSSACRTNQ